LATLALAAAGALGGCSSVTDKLLEAKDPDFVDPADVNSPDAADALRLGALVRFRAITGGGGGEGSTWLFGGLLADEWSTSSTFVQNDEADERQIKEDNGTVDGMWYRLHRARTAANQALTSLKVWRPTASAAIAEMYLVRGFAELQLASDFCSPMPVGDGSGDAIVLGPPITRTEVLNKALASLDTAMSTSATLPLTDTAGTNIHRAARVARARAFVALNRMTEAAALVPQGSGAGQVPNNFTYNNTFSLTGGDNTLWAQPRSSRRYTVSDSLEGNAREFLVKNATPFFSAKDPRVPVNYTVSSNGRDTTKSQDGFTFSRTTTVWDRLTLVPVANGIDARLIQAEERLSVDDYVQMTAILNALRDTSRTLGAISSGRMALLTAPTTKDAAINLFFREKAFWTFSRGQRLGDLRRLMKYYGRAQNQVFPVGRHYRGADYGTDIALPVPNSERNNPNYTNIPRPVGDACNNG
jgi:hypothetical protein